MVMRDLTVTDLGSDEDNQKQTEFLHYVFRWYVCFYLPCFALNEMFGSKYHSWGPVSYLMFETDDGTKKERVPPSTEAWALLAYENCYEKWINTHEYLNDPSNKDKKRPRYEKKKDPNSIKFSGLYSDPNSGQARFGGWTQDGLERFYALCSCIHKNRKENKAHIQAIDQVIVDKILEEQEANGGEKAPKKAKKGAKPAPKKIAGADYEEEI